MGDGFWGTNDYLSHPKHPNTQDSSPITHHPSPITHHLPKGVPPAMQIGVMMRSGRTRASGATTDPLRWNELREMAQLADDVGVDTLCIPDHLLFRNAGNVQLPEGETRGNWEAFSIMSALAASTKRATLLPMVACTSFRNPAMLAKIADTIDEISGGRVLLGLGAGWHEP